MKEDYQRNYSETLGLLKTIIHGSETFLPGEVAGEENQLNHFLTRLRENLHEQGEYNKYALRRCMNIQTVLSVEYWSDISEKRGWAVIYQGFEELREPEKITRESNAHFVDSILDKCLTVLPVTRRAQKDIEKAKNRERES